jgi:hypothetical protein
MGMRQSDMIGIVGKTQDAVQAQHTNVKGPVIHQENLAIKEAQKADRASEQVIASAPDDRVDLSSKWQGGSGAGEEDESSKKSDPEDKPAVPEEISPEEHHIDFLA